MKKFVFTLSILISSLFCATADDDRDYAIAFSQLPEAAQTFVNTHFSGIQVSYCLKDYRSFEVKLAEASEIEFNGEGEWKEVDCKRKELPASIQKLLPASIPAYIKTNFPSALITKISKKFRGYEVELDNGLELDFGKDGKFKRLDD